MNKIAGFPERLSEIMRDYNINMSDMAKRAGTSKQSISRYIAGDRQPKTDKVDAIAVSFGVNPLWLMGYDCPKFLADVNNNRVSITNNNSGNAVNTVAQDGSTVSITYTPQEVELIETFRGLSLADQIKALNFIFSLKEGKQ